MSCLIRVFEVKFLQDGGGLILVGYRNRWRAKGKYQMPSPHAVIPRLIVKSADEAIRWYQQAFGAELVLRLVAPNGKVVHTQINIGEVAIEITEEDAKNHNVSR
jgi:hypothetical protein